MQVEKRNGTHENFDSLKLRNSFIAAGLDEVTANDLLQEIENWAENNSRGGVITTRAIWQEVIRELSERDRDAAARYRGYRHDISQG